MKTEQSATALPLKGAQKKPSADPQTAAILTKAQAAQLLGCTTRFIERRITDGTLRACKAGRKFVRLFRKDIDRFLESYATTKGGE